MQNRPNRRMILALGPALALSGCGGLGLGPPESQANATLYMLQPSFGPAPAGQTAGWALAVDVPDAPDALDSRRIALIKADGTMDYYANAEWTDRLPLLIQTALVAGFETSGRLPQVSRTQDALHADYELGTELRDFGAHYSTPDGAPGVTITLIAQMSTARGRKIVANFTASQSAPASLNATAAAVAAFNAALGAAVSQIVNWAVALPPPSPSSADTLTPTRAPTLPPRPAP